MSLLADLLAKLKTGSPPGGDELSPPFDVPPTLSRGQKIPAKVPGLRRRYIAISGLALLLVLLGVLLMARLKEAPEKLIEPERLGQPKDFRTAPFSSAGQPAQQAPATGEPSTLKPNAARLQLGEPPVPEAAPPRTAAQPNCPPCPPPQRPRAHPPALPVPRLAAPAPAPAAATRGAAAPAAKGDSAARDSFLYAARSAEQARDWKGALTNYRKALELDPGNYRILSNAAAALNNLGLYDEGAREAERALAQKPDYVPALINAAIAHSSAGNVAKARRLFAQAQSVDPGNRSALLNLATLDERSGHLDEALALYRQLWAGGDPVALQGMARIYERKGKKAEALRSYRQILAQPNASPALKQEVKGRLARLEEQGGRPVSDF